MPAIAPVLWVCLAPCGTAALVGGVRPIRELVARTYWLSIAVGWLAAAALVYAAVAMTGPTQLAVVLVTAPITGLGIWVRRGGGGGSDRPKPPEPVPPEPEREDAPRRRPALRCERRTRARRPAPVPRATSYHLEE